MKSLKIATYNVRKLRGDNKENITDAIVCDIRKFEPDILALNELHAATDVWENQHEILARALGYKYFYFAEALFIEDAPYGIALLSKFPIKSAKNNTVPDPIVKDENTYYETRTVLDAKIDIDGEYFHVLVSHFGLSLKERLNAVQTVRKLIPENPEKTLLMGDFNCKPDAEELSPIHAILKDSAAGSDILTFSSTNPYAKIDYIFTSEDIQTENTHVIEKTASDHLMLCTTIKW